MYPFLELRLSSNSYGLSRCECPRQLSQHPGPALLPVPVKSNSWATVACRSTGERHGQKGVTKRHGQKSMACWPKAPVVKRPPHVDARLPAEGSAPGSGSTCFQQTDEGRPPAVERARRRFRSGVCNFNSKCLCLISDPSILAFREVPCSNPFLTLLSRPSKTSRVAYSLPRVRLPSRVSCCPAWSVVHVSFVHAC